VATETTDDSFPVALRELLIEHDYSTASGNPNWTAFAEELRGVHYETLRRAAAGERSPSARLIEECARALRLPPDYFLEYRLYLAQRNFDPKAVGLERAVENLKRWSARA
jgi:transcriptional regulator with XRE-family HTH domain